jgi:hypothetical protein
MVLTPVAVACFTTAYLSRCALVCRCGEHTPHRARWSLGWPQLLHMRPGGRLLLMMSFQDHLATRALRG